MRAAETCAAVKACGGYSAEPCVPDNHRPDNHRCEAGVAFNCQLEGGALETRDVCRAAGNERNERCSVVMTEREETLAICHGSACAGARCDGAVLIHCVGGLEVREDCARDGRTCSETAASPVCSHADSCTRDTCRGDELRLCAFGRVLLTAECGNALPGSRCVEIDGTADCLAITPRPECSEHDLFESWCEADLAVTCSANVRSEIDCATLRGGRCVTWRVGDELDAVRAGCRAPATEDPHAPLRVDP